MSILIENIKLYSPLNNSYLRFNQIILIIMLFIIIPAGYAENKMAMAIANNEYPFIPLYFLIISTALLGSMIAVVKAEIMTKPFSFCLPEHNRITARALFIAGIFVNLIYLAVFAFLPHPAGINRILYFVSIPAAGLFFYFLAAFHTFYVQYNRKRALTSFFSLLIFIIAFFLFYDSPPRLDFFIYYITPLLLLAGILLMYALFKLLLKPDFKRKLFTNDSLLNLNYSQRTPQDYERLMIKRLPDSEEKETLLDRHFAKAMKSPSYTNKKRNFIGELYCMLNRYYTFNHIFFRVSLSLKIVILTLLLFLAGYLHPGKIEGIPLVFTHMIPLFLAAIPGFFLVSAFSPVLHNQLLPIGRSDQFFKDIALWLLKPFMFIIWLSLILIAAGVSAPFMPEFTVGGYVFSYNTLRFSILIQVIVIIPVMDVFMYYFQMPCRVLTMIAITAALLMLFLFGIFATNNYYRLIATALLIFLATVFFIYQLAMYWFRKDISSFT